MPTPKNNKYAATAWGGEKFIDLECPSGQLCQVRRPGVEGLIRVGLLRETDNLTSLVENKHIRRVKGQKEIDVSKLMEDTAQLLKVMATVDKIVCYVVVQPSLVRPIQVDDETGEPLLDEATGEELMLNDDQRKDGVIYTDVIDLEDRMFIFQYAVGGSKDIERFRGELNKSVRGVAAK